MHLAYIERSPWSIASIWYVLIPFLRNKYKSHVEKCCLKFKLLKKFKCNDIRIDIQQQQNTPHFLTEKYSIGKKNPELWQL